MDRKELEKIIKSCAPIVALVVCQLIEIKIDKDKKQ